MRWATFRPLGGEDRTGRVGVVMGEQIQALAPGVRLLDLLGDDGDRLARAGEEATTNSAEMFERPSVELLAPLPRPPSVRDFYAFEQHVKTARARRGLDMDPDWYELPVFYFSNPAAILGPRANTSQINRRSSGSSAAAPTGCSRASAGASRATST